MANQKLHVANSASSSPTGTPGTAETATPSPASSTTGTTTLTWKIPMAPQDRTLPDGNYEFVWTGAHNVYQFNDKQAYDTCDFTKAALVGAVSPVVVRKSSSQSGGTMYYGCELSGHCEAGQKVAITIGTGTEKKNKRLEPLILYSSFTVTGVSTTDLQDSETRQKLTVAIAKAVGVSPERVTIVKISDVRRRRLGDSVSVEYHVVVYTEEERKACDPNCGNARVAEMTAKMETLGTDQGVTNTIAEQVGIDAESITVTPGKVTPSDKGSTDQDESKNMDIDNKDKPTSEFLVLGLVLLVVVLGLAVVGLLFHRRRQNSHNSLNGTPDKQKDSKEEPDGKTKVTIKVAANKARWRFTRGLGTNTLVFLISSFLRPASCVLSLLHFCVLLFCFVLCFSSLLHCVPFSNRRVYRPSRLK